MFAGKTKIECGTIVRITKISNPSDADDAALVGLRGRITHPFRGLMSGTSSRYLAGIEVDPADAAEYLIDRVNIMVGDEVEIVED